MIPILWIKKWIMKFRKIVPNYLAGEMSLIELRSFCLFVCFGFCFCFCFFVFLSLAFFFSLTLIQTWDRAGDDKNILKFHINIPLYLA